ncbi:glycosyltransferase family 2 protein [Sphingobacterium haloxyli]|uniref:Glycosyl transferase family 2 n=1 Tax=Sphingobacterium haloxyli TaxID=2100533 RepID=A0A2S9J274_9SPHI|nr:glycosyltransferase [Sphingobacterium haloxyli]PRD46850.1 glycosyl transferase family 2 [Sphingobacterium haloxyli]
MFPKPKVSIVIVSMNNVKQLFPCLDSIARHTSLKIEVLVVAYLFSKENLVLLRESYPWIRIIESNEIRGFSENNNLALRESTGEYCFVLNDDTEFRMSVLEKLVESIESLKEDVAIMSPVTVFPNGKIQTCGRPPIDFKTYISLVLRLCNEKSGPYVNQSGIFKSYNILGAAFLIKREIFAKVGWFDERFFFCPEDIALSTKLNKLGYSCYVDSSVEVVHYEGMSGKSTSLVQTATKPAACIGNIIFHSEDNKFKELFLRMLLFNISILKFIMHSCKSLGKSKTDVNYILSLGDLNCASACLSRLSPKQLFVKYYNTIKKR